MKIVAFWSKLHWCLYPRIQVNWQWARIGSDNGFALVCFSNQWRPTLLTHTCVIRTQWVEDDFNSEQRTGKPPRPTQAKLTYIPLNGDPRSVYMCICECIRASVCICICICIWQRSNTAVYRHMYICMYIWLVRVWHRHSTWWNCLDRWLASWAGSTYIHEPYCLLKCICKKWHFNIRHNRVDKCMSSIVYTWKIRSLVWVVVDKSTSFKN